MVSLPAGLEERTCSLKALDSICSRVSKAVSEGHGSLAVVVLPGSFNPVHTEHVQTLKLAKKHLDDKGIAVVGGFLQPSSDAYVSQKVGPDSAMRLADRIAVCELAGENAKEQDEEPWIHPWRSGQTNGFAVPQAVEKFLNNVIPERVNAPKTLKIVAFMVCGADLVLRFGGWSRPPPIPVMILQRPGVSLPTSQPCDGWELAEGEMKDVSSTKIRDAIKNGDWKRLEDEGCDPSVVELMSSRQQEGNLFMACSKPCEAGR